MTTAMQVMTRCAWDWGVRAFKIDHMTGQRVRAVRTAEEGLELCCSVGVDRDQLHRLVDVVCDRKHADPIQELGGVLLTSCIFAELRGMTPEDVFERELRRCLAKNPEDFAKRNQEKLDLGLTG